jgi:SAM-dependent methyltransferase
MEMLLPDQLQALWRAVEEKRLTAEEFTREQERLLGEYQRTWTQALLLNGRQDLRESLLSELGMYDHCDDAAEVLRRCERAVETLKHEWHAQVHGEEQQAIERFYDQSKTTMYELMWWHTLGDDMSPLAYVTALHFARQHGCERYLDFGAGVGSGGILFARHGLDVTLADISSTLLQFCRWRMQLRGLSIPCIDLKAGKLRQNAYDFITAMDVFEHLTDPVTVVEDLAKALRSEGFLYARISVESGEDRPQHIVRDFGPTFQRIEELGLVQVWQDAWLWGHRVFQKATKD